ncbi:MAG: RIP metalloprotease RseP [Lentisphaeria bacterium]|nr:RIP metalloprotease RseP [Lentisphaeria bacterium]
MDVFLDILKIFGRSVFVVFFFGFSIFIHEFGHLLAAKWRQLHVERFSIGFGKPLWKWRKWNIDFLVSMLPFGGYVALPQLDPTDTPVTESGEKLPAIKPVDRIIVAFAGPLFNIGFGLFLGVFIWVFGVMGRPPADSFVIASIPETYVDSKGLNQSNPEFEVLQPGDEVVAINGQEFHNGARQAFEMIVYAPAGKVTLDIIRDGSKLQASYVPAKNAQFEGLGFPFFTAVRPPIVGGILKGSAAEAAGIQAHDVLVEINGQKIVDQDFLTNELQLAEGAPVTLKILRPDHTDHTDHTDRKRKEKNYKEIIIENVQAVLTKRPDGKMYYLLGVDWRMRLCPSPVRQLQDVVVRTYRTLHGLFDRANHIRPKHLMGPVGIAQNLYNIVRYSLMTALSFVVLINFSLALLNLFPLPVLDGGHITSAIIQIIIRRTIPTRLAVRLQYGCFFLLIGLMLYITFYDVMRLTRSTPMRSKTGTSEPATKENGNAPAGDPAAEDPTPAPPGELPAEAAP